MRKVFKYTGIGISAAVLLVVVLIGALFAVGSSKLQRSYQVQLASLVIPSDSVAIERGAHLSRIYGCTDCHGADLSGKVFVDDPPFRVTATNLTPGRGGIGSTYTYEDFDRAIRHGIHPSGRSLFIMPSSVFNNMSDEDVSMLIAYLNTIEPIDTDHPPTEIRPLGRILASAMIDPAFEVRTGAARAGMTPEIAPTAEYGAYLSSIVCAHCHGEDLRGIEVPPAPGSPPAPDLAASGQWTNDVFDRALREGITPTGRQMDPRFMPWPVTAEMTETEIRAIQAHLAMLTD
ncbi:MAG: c-type cytochrome [Bacteroidota bacterium]